MVDWYGYTAMKTTVNLDDQLLREAKMQAATEGTTLARFVEEALKSALTARGAPARQELRWVVVDGGPPRVDIADRNALYEFMERTD